MAHEDEDQCVFFLRHQTTTLTCLNVIKQKKIANVKRSARVKALALASQSKMVLAFRVSTRIFLMQDIADS